MYNIIKRFIYMLPPQVAHTILHLKNNKQIINWNNPKTYDQKLRYLLVKVYGKNFSKYVDKYQVREYIKQLRT